MAERLEELGAHIAASKPDAVAGHSIAYGELTVDVVPALIVDLAEFLRTDALCRFSTLVDITAIDRPEREARFDIVYHFLSMYQNQRVRVKAAVHEDAMMPSVTGLFPGAGWYEREVFDMFGILFSGHPDLRRILTDYGFRGHPLRKDFPTTGFVEVRYDEEVKRVVYEPVSLVQEYRAFDFMSPWEGASEIFSADERAREAK